MDLHAYTIEKYNGRRWVPLFGSHAELGPGEREADLAERLLARYMEKDEPLRSSLRVRVRGTDMHSSLVVAEAWSAV